MAKIKRLEIAASLALLYALWVFMPFGYNCSASLLTFELLPLYIEKELVELGDIANYVLENI